MLLGVLPGVKRFWTDCMSCGPEGSLYLYNYMYRRHAPYKSMTQRIISFKYIKGAGASKSPHIVIDIHNNHTSRKLRKQSANLRHPLQLAVAVFIFRVRADLCVRVCILPDMGQWSPLQRVKQPVQGCTYCKI